MAKLSKEDISGLLTNVGAGRPGQREVSRSSGAASVQTEHATSTNSSQSMSSESTISSGRGKGFSSSNQSVMSSSVSQNMSSETTQAPGLQTSMSESIGVNRSRSSTQHSSTAGYAELDKSASGSQMSSVSAGASMSRSSSDDNRGGHSAGAGGKSASQVSTESVGGGKAQKSVVDEVIQQSGNETLRTATITRDDGTVTHIREHSVQEGDITSSRREQRDIDSEGRSTDTVIKSQYDAKTGITQSTHEQVGHAKMFATEARDIGLASHSHSSGWSSGVELSNGVSESESVSSNSLESEVSSATDTTRSPGTDESHSASLSEGTAESKADVAEQSDTGSSPEHRASGSASNNQPDIVFESISSSSEADAKDFSSLSGTSSPDFGGTYNFQEGSGSLAQDALPGSSVYSSEGTPDVTQYPSPQPVTNADALKAELQQNYASSSFSPETGKDAALEALPSLGPHKDAVTEAMQQHLETHGFSSMVAKEAAESLAAEAHAKISNALSSGRDLANETMDIFLGKGGPEHVVSLQTLDHLAQLGLPEGGLQALASGIGSEAQGYSNLQLMDKVGAQNVANMETTGFPAEKVNSVTELISDLSREASKGETSIGFSSLEALAFIKEVENAHNAESMAFLQMNDDKSMSLGITGKEDFSKNSNLVGVELSEVKEVFDEQANQRNRSKQQEAKTTGPEMAMSGT